MTYDIQLFNLDNYEWTEQLFDFYEKIGWIEPDCIVGFDKALVKAHNLERFDTGIMDEAETADKMIASYYEYRFKIEADIEKFTDVSLWLIMELADSTPTYIFPVQIREYFKTHGTQSLNDCFNKIYQAIAYHQIHSPKIVTYLLTEFLFETFQYGSEWGVFVEPRGKPSITYNVLSVEQANEHDYLCSKLSAENLQKLANVETLNFDFPKAG